MAMADNTSKAAAKFTSLPIGRQIGLLVGLAVSIAIGVGVILWAKEPHYRPLYANLSSRDASEIIDILQNSGIPYKISSNNSTISVEGNHIQQARLKLAAEGLPRGNGHGFEFFSKSNSFTTSQFMENARMRHALETELARTISQFNNVKSARIHLAIPRESAFVRRSKRASASVFVDLYPGIELRKNTIASIVNLVASSVPNMSSERVTVVDQNGQLLNEGGGVNSMTATDRYMDYRFELEQNYARKIEEILTPIIGFGQVHAKVSADIDFTTSEQTRELYNPDLLALRSEQTMSEKRQVGTEVAGVAGALSNQAPAKPQTAQETTKSATTQAGVGANDIRRQTTKNYELDKTISHTKNRPGRIQRLTVAVLVGNRKEFNPKTKKLEAKPMTKQEIDKLRLLVADSIGLNFNRGDSLNVINSDFVKPEPIKSLPAKSMFQEDWFWNIVKQSLGGLFLLIFIFGVLKPILKALASNKNLPVDAGGTQQLPGAEGANTAGQLANYANNVDQSIAIARDLAGSEPKRVAQVVKTWIDGGNS
jgi:flagellar M-ring protein FliF